jgi:hypothetical protein
MLEVKMKILHPNSLAKTLDAVNEIFFSGGVLTRSERTEIATWIAGRQGVKGAYRGMFAPTEQDYERGVKLFTGEKILSRAAIGHIIGEEASRALILLDGNSTVAREALKRSNRGMLRALMSCEAPNMPRGFYCCGTCTAAMWRHLAVGGLDKSRKRLSAGMKTLRKYRDGTGRWRRFPFYYTLLALNEMKAWLADSELRYAAPVCERLLKRNVGKNKFAKRRIMLLERILARL